MNRTYPQTAAESICGILERHSDPHGKVDSRRAWRDLLHLPLDPVDVQKVLNRLEHNGYLTRLGGWVFLAKPVRCPGCNRWTEVTLTTHMHDDHPRRLRVTWVE